MLVLAFRVGAFRFTLVSTMASNEIGRLEANFPTDRLTMTMTESDTAIPFSAYRPMSTTTSIPFLIFHRHGTYMLGQMLVFMPGGRQTTTEVETILVLALEFRLVAAIFSTETLA